jgi:hypothetical protein
VRDHRAPAAVPAAKPQPKEDVRDHRKDDK